MPVKVAIACFSFWVAVIVAMGFAVSYMAVMPGQSVKQNAGPLSESEAAMVPVLKSHVETLATEIGPRNNSDFPENLVRAKHYIATVWEKQGYKIERQTFEAQGKPSENLYVELKGTSEPATVITIGAHYDSCKDTPGANDNGSGVAALLELSRVLKDLKPKKTLRFVAFTNESQPYFRTSDMGSCHYVEKCIGDSEKLAGTLILETIGYYSDVPGSQKFPLPFVDLVIGNRGNFIGFVSNLDSREFLHEVISRFRQTGKFPSQGLCAPDQVRGIDWSDQFYFWQHKLPAVMITDSAVYRYPEYHKKDDLPDRLSYESLARVTVGLAQVADNLCR